MMAAVRRSPGAARGRQRAASARCLVAGGVLCLAVGIAHACAPHVEERAGVTTASLRRHTDDFSRCPVDESTYRQVIRDWLRQRPSGAPVLTGISLGRAIDLPWLARDLAEAAARHPQWDARRGRVRLGEINAFVAALLSDEAFLARLAVPFADAGYRPLRVTVEKVLVGRASEIFPEMAGGTRRLPVDAQLWLVVQSVSRPQ